MRNTTITNSPMQTAAHQKVNAITTIEGTGEKSDSLLLLEILGDNPPAAENNAGCPVSLSQYFAEQTN